MQRALITGVTGYIGGSLATRLAAEDWAVQGVLRDAAAVERVARTGVTPVVADLGDAARLTALAREADLVVHAADSDHRGAVEALLAGLRGTGKTFVHVSGSSIVADVGTGERSERVFDEHTDFTPIAAKTARVAIDRLVRDAAGDGVRSVVVCPPMIHGRGLGSKLDSIQVPMLIRESMRQGAGVHLGRGLNVWSTLHIEDLVDLFALVIARAEPGEFYFAENGEVALRDVAAAIAELLGLTGTVAWPVDAAAAVYGDEAARLGLASNSRIRATRARALGWRPSRPGLLEDVARGSYHEFVARERAGAAA